jgi:hypothetical protein
MRFAPSRNQCGCFRSPRASWLPLERGSPRGSGRSRRRRATLRRALLPFEVPAGPVAGVGPFSQSPVPRCSPAVDPGRLLLAHIDRPIPLSIKALRMSPVPLDRTAWTVCYFRIDLNNGSVLYLTSVVNSRYRGNQYRCHSVLFE